MAGLSLRDVSKSYGSAPVVGGVSIDVQDGELFVLVGPSGSGKTTLLRLIAGLETVDAGSITIGTRDVTSLPPADRDVAMVFQSYALFPHMTVYDNLAFGLAARGRPAEEIRERVGSVAGRLGLAALLTRRPPQLSGGERQRVALGRAMVREPSVFLMDEPLSNLDAQLRTQTRGEIVGLQERLGTTTVYVTHDQVEALAMGHRMAVLRDGALEQIGGPQEIYDAPATAFVAGFIGNPPMNLLAARREGESLVWGDNRTPLDAHGDATPAEVILGVRPEHVHLAGSRWSGGIPGARRFRARVERLEPLGDQSIVTLDTGRDTRLLARVEPAFHPARGERVEGWLDRVHLFDAGTGRRL